MPGRKRKGNIFQSISKIDSLLADNETSNGNDTAAAVSNVNTEDEIEDPEIQSLEYINLTTHTGHFGSNPIKLNWGAPTPKERGPVIATVSHLAWS